MRVPVAALSMQSVTPNISTDNKRGFPSTDNNMSSLSSCNHVRGDILVDFFKCDFNAFIKHKRFLHPLYFPYGLAA